MKAQKDRHIKGSIFSILICNYILFTLVFVFCGFCIYMLAASHMRGIINEPLYQKLIGYRSCLLNDEYYDLPVEKLLGKGSMIQILNEKNELIYESKKNIAPSQYTAGEIECIPLFNDYRYASIHDLQWKDDTSRRQKLLTINYYDGVGEREETYLLNQQNQIIKSTVSTNGRTSFTEKELGYMLGEYPGNIWIQKYVYKNKFGISRTLLLILPNISEHEYRNARNELNMIIYGLIGFYIMLVVFFVLVANRVFKVPLRLLNRALLNFAEGNRKGNIEYSGPVEFVKICNSFNIMADRLSQSEQENQKLTDEKSKMLADISHDLKTPVTVIQGYSKALSDDLIPDQNKKQYYDVIYRKSKLLGTLINKFYEYSKLEHPDFKFNFVKTDICEFAREYLADTFEELRVSGYDLIVCIPDIRMDIMTDQMQMKRVFDNLISNSVSHTCRGTKIYFDIEKTDKQVRILYADDGPGINPTIAAHIFEPFVVEDPARNQNGSGLGLSIAQKIVQAHQGSIRIVLPPKQYSTEFEILLPMV